MLRSACSRYRLPPGDVGDIEQLEKSDRYYLLHQTSQFGPIFKGKGANQLWVCIVGLRRCRRFLQENAKNLQGHMHDLDPLVPKGALRKMEGEDHRKYRNALNSGIRIQDLFQNDLPFGEIASTELRKFAATQDSATDPAVAYRGTLNAIATASLIKVFFGASPETQFFNSLIDGYRKLGRYGYVWNIGPQQEHAFAEIRNALSRFTHFAESKASAPFTNSIAGKLSADNVLDDTLLGNLIYMVELGRYDLAGLFRWLTKYVAANPTLLERLAIEAKQPVDRRDSLARAIVMETLRTDKSERLGRIAQRDLIFDGYLIPRNSHIRLCLWEAHHSAEIFDKPFEFDPERFLQAPVGPDQYSPFGLDHHRCPLGEIATILGIVFLNELASNYRLESFDDGRAIRGAYHWEPAAEFGVRLKSHGDPQR